jgi:hypothetical protein
VLKYLLGGAYVLDTGWWTKLELEHCEILIAFHKEIICFVRSQRVERTNDSSPITMYKIGTSLYDEQNCLLIIGE